MKKLPLERLVCAPGQAREFLELLGCDAPVSYFKWVCYNDETSRLMNPTEWREARLWRHIDIIKVFPAYTGDELGVLFKNVTATLPNYPVSLTVRDKAALAIQGLREGWIKPEEFRYA